MGINPFKIYSWLHQLWTFQYSEGFSRTFEVICTKFELFNTIEYVAALMR